MEKLEISSFVLMPRKKTAICYQANFKRNVYGQTFYWGGGGARIVNGRGVAVKDA